MRYLLPVLFVFIGLSGHAQQEQSSTMNPEQEVSFIYHLLRLQDYEYAQMEIDRIDLTLLDESWRDSLIFLKGWVAYWQKDLDTAIKYMLRSDTSNHFYEQARFYAAICASNQHNISYSNQILYNTHLTNDVHQSLRFFELSGNALLQNDLKTYDSLRVLNTNDYYALQEPQATMDELAQDIKDFNPRSKFLAAAFSTVVPGLGKVYAGKYGEGISAFLISGLLGVVTWENYRKDGLTNWKTLVAGTVFTTYYIGNIWGSYFSVQMKRQEFYDQVHHQILINMHIPLRTIF